MAALRERPLLHFAAIGVLLFAFAHGGDAPDTDSLEANRAPIAISAERLRLAENEFSQRLGRPALNGEREALVHELVDQEILHREAFRLGLDRSDFRVEQRLVRKMKILSRNPGAPRAELLAEARSLEIDRSDPLIRRMLVQQMQQLLRSDPAARVSEEQLSKAISEVESKAVKPAAITFSQVYLGVALPAEREWSTLRDRLVDPRRSPGDHAAFSLPLPVGGTLRAWTHARLARQFGGEFASRVFELGAGGWSEPLSSPYGHHLVFVHEVAAERPVDRALLRQRALSHVSDERADARLAASLGWLRTLYSIRVAGVLVEGVAEGAGPAAGESGT